MSKNRTTRKRMQAHGQMVRQTRIVVAIAVAVLALTVLVLTLSNRSVASPMIPQENTIHDAIRGNPNAPVTIIEYGAYSCPSCRAWHRAHIIDNILATYHDKVRFIFRDFPVITPPYDRMAAATARCALDQSQDGFWAFHDALYTTANASYSQEDLLRLGEKVGLSYDRLRACTAANTYVGTVQYEESLARNLGLPGTPSFLINGKPIFDASPDTLKTVVEQALRS